MISNSKLLKLGMGVFLVFTPLLLNGEKLEGDKKYDGIWVESQDEKIVLDSTQMRPNPSPLLRKGAKKEITDLRNDIEDKLRIYLLATYWEQEKIKKVKDILNKSWDKKGTDFLWSDVFETTDETKEPVDNFKKEMLLNLLFYVASNYSSGIDKVIQDKIDNLFLEMQKNHQLQEAKGEISFWNNFVDGFAQYGSLKLISPAIWDYLRKAQSWRLYSFLKVFKYHLPKEDTVQLKQFVQSISWQDNDKYRVKIEQTINLIERLVHYPILSILVKCNESYAKVLLAEVEKLNITEGEKIKFLELKIVEYTNSLIEVDNNQDISEEQKEQNLKESNEIKSELNEFIRKKKEKTEKEKNPKDSSEPSSKDDSQKNQKPK